ncbi:RelA/SpoT domain-containing protein [Ruminococcaceae bacterium OttesenSCG-928-D13]|nr:RelA/SpoT domain-containing protein [Ruminococcaceae bacterium OttesenSCG-928-D13]
MADEFSAIHKEVDSILIDSVVEFYCDEMTQFLVQNFLEQVLIFFRLNPVLQKIQTPAIHSLKSRLKEPEHLRDKLTRKANKGIVVTRDTLFQEVTDLAGVRVLHLHQEQFKAIHSEIMKKIGQGDWLLGESPKAYTWDPETQAFFDSLSIQTEVRETYYTSVHYLVKPNNQSNICCEIQVRTLFEEIWGEIDHIINYPERTNSVACAEQLRVLSKLVSTGTRLSDSIFRSYKEHIESSSP